MMGSLRLVAGVMSQAMRDAIDGNGDEGLGAHLWIASDSMAHWSFLWCCSIMGLEPGAVRDALRRNPAEIKKRLIRFEGTRKSWRNYDNVAMRAGE